MESKDKLCLEHSTAERIIEAAVPLFAAKGFAGVSIREIAGTANVNIGSISYYFNGKEGLYVTILKQQFEKIMPRAESVKNSSECAPQKLQCVIKNMTGLHKQSPFVFKLIFNEINNPTCCREIVEEYVGKLKKILQSIIAEGISQKEFRSDLDPAFASLMVHSIVHYAFLFPNFSKMLLANQEDKLDYYISQVTDYFFKGILAADKH